MHPNEGSNRQILDELYVDRSIPYQRFEYVDVTFPAADTDVVIPYTKLRPADPSRVRWVDATPTAVWNGAADTHPHLYRSASPSRILWARGYIVLRSTVAGYTTRLLLTTERES